MGTNYYLVCSSCGQRKHIGKASAGWAFSLHIYPTENILDLDDWKPILSKHEIVDEYGDKIEWSDMVATITRPDWNGRPLLRHSDGHPGRGDWDCIEGEFS
jgi:hypothetical protein